MNVTMATDMALSRMFYQQGLMQQIHEALMYALLMNNYDPCDRIVNTNGKVVARYQNVTNDCH